MASGTVKRLQDLTPEERYTLQKACRHKMRLKLLADIQADMIACWIEGWDQTEYIRELQELLNSFKVKHDL